MSDYERREQHPPPARPPVGTARFNPAAGPGGGPNGEPPTGPGGNMGRASVVSAGRARTAEKSKPKKKRMSMRRRRTYAALILVALMLIGSGTVIGAAFFQSVPLPDELAFGESTTFAYSDETAVAGYGEFTRKLVDDYEDLPRSVVWSLLALEDKNYFEHEGVDYKGTLRALINNVTGGDTQGASTISQQYAGMVAELRDDISYGRKAREAIMAMKLEQEYSKENILLHYLNLNFYNRGAYGIAAASEVWFGKKIADLTWGESMVLVMQVKAGDGSFDPRLVEEDDTAPLDRWTHGMESLLALEDLTEDEKQLVQEQLDAGMPETSEQIENPGSWGHDTPTGFITNPTDGYVWDELEERYGLPQEQFYGHDEGTGGYTVVLTIDSAIQKQAEATASRGSLKRVTDEDDNFLDADGNVVENEAAAAEYRNEDGYFEFENSNENAALYDYHPSMASAVVAVEPGTGRVLGYYGGDNGLGVDKAGPENPHPPSSVFKMITAATAIRNGASIDSWWNSDSPRAFEARGEAGDVENAGGDENTDRTLTDAVRDSSNTPMYAIADKYGAAVVLETAVLMGLRTLKQVGGDGDTYRFYLEDDGTITYSRHNTIQHDDGTYETLENGDIDRWASLDGYNDDGTPVRTPLDLENPRSLVDNEIGYGQFPTSVMDMATIYATIAADGMYNETHFVEAVYDREGNEVQPVRELESNQALDAGGARDLQWVGSEIDGNGEPLDRDYTGKTGTWEAGEDYPKEANSHTWYLGAIPQLSIAAWVGNATAESAPLLNTDGGYSNIFGATLSYPVWRQFLDLAIEDKGYEKAEWGEPQHIGADIVDDIVNADGTIDSDSPYCAQNPTDDRCGRPDRDDDDDDDDECDPFSELLGQCTGEDRGRDDDRDRGRDDD